jgi:hypothetical protein
LGINQQNQIDSYHEQNLIGDTDYFNTSVDLDNQLKQIQGKYADIQ